MSKDNQKSPIIHDYWVDDENNKIYAIIEYTNEEIKDNKSNVYLIEKKK